MVEMEIRLIESISGNYFFIRNELRRRSSVRCKRWIGPLVLHGQ